MDIKTIEALLHLQEIDREVIHLQKKLDLIPIEIAKINEKIKANQANLSEKKLNMENLLKRRKETELELESQNNKLKKLDGQLYSLKNNKEYAAMLKEIQEIKQTNEKLEERILEVLFLCDKEREEFKSAEREFREYESQVLSEVDEKKKEENNLKSILQEKIDLKNKQIACIDKNSVAIYGRIMKNKNDFALVEVKDEVCQGCHMGIPPQMINDLIMSSELYRCPSCSRILYINTPAECKV